MIVIEPLYIYIYNIFLLMDMMYF